MEPGLDEVATPLVTSQLLGKAKIPGLGYENPDGSRLVVNGDYFGNERSGIPTPGPFEKPGDGSLKLKVW